MKQPVEKKFKNNERASYLSQYYPNTITTLFQHYPKNLSYPQNEQN